MHPHNYMRSTALTLGLLAPLHPMDPSMIQCYSAVVALVRLSARSHVVILSSEPFGGPVLDLEVRVSVLPGWFVTF